MYQLKLHNDNAKTDQYKIKKSEINQYICELRMWEIDNLNKGKEIGITHK